VRWPTRALGRFDAFQQRNRPIGFVLGVVKKFADDRAGMLAALIAYYGFLALFPLMLLLVTVLGLAMRNNPSLQQRVLQSALSDFPVLGAQIRTNIHTLRASPVATVVGVLGLVWGSLGVTQASQFAMSQIWDVRAEDRPTLVTRVVRGLSFIGVLGVGLAVTTLLTEVGGFSGNHALWFRAPFVALGGAVNVGIYLAAFRLLTPRSVERRDLIPGAVVGGLGWSVLQFVGTFLVEHQLRHTSQVYGVFAVVLGLLAWLFLLAQLTLYAAEINVVRARRLWPRTLVQVGPRGGDAPTGSGSA